MDTFWRTLIDGASEGARSFPIVLAVAFVFRIVRFPDIGLIGGITLGSATLVALMKIQWPLPAAIAVSALSGVGTGVMNSILFVGFRVSPFLSGIITMSAAYAAGYWILGRSSTSSVSGTSGYFSEWACLKIALGLSTFLLLILSTKFGLRLRFAGEQPEIFHLLGRRPHHSFIGLLVISGVISAFAGALHSAVSAACSINHRGDLLFNSMVALVLGDAARAAAHWIGMKLGMVNGTIKNFTRRCRIITAVTSGTSSAAIFAGALVGSFLERILYQITITYIPAQAETNAIVGGIAAIAVISMNIGNSASYLRGEWRFNDVLR